MDSSVCSMHMLAFYTAANGADRRRAARCANSSSSTVRTAWVTLASRSCAGRSRIGNFSTKVCNNY